MCRKIIIIVTSVKKKTILLTTLFMYGKDSERIFFNKVGVLQ